MLLSTHKDDINKHNTCTHKLINDTKLKTWFRRLLRHPARKQVGPILQLPGHAVYE